jgi:hypothetical protein
MCALLLFLWRFVFFPLCVDGTWFKSCCVRGVGCGEARCDLSENVHLFSSIFEECSETFTNEICQEFVEEADLLCACISLCNSWIGASKEMKDVCKGSVVVSLVDGVDEVVVIAVVEGGECGGGEGLEFGFVDNECEVS